MKTYTLVVLLLVHLCAGKASGETDCQTRRVRECEVSNTFILMVNKLRYNRKYLIGSLINQIETMQNITSGNQQRIHEIDKNIADLSTQNLVIVRLYTKGILSSADYSAQSSEINNKISELRIEHRKKLGEDEDDQLLNVLKNLDEILEETDFQTDFNEELFERIVENITVQDNTNLTYRLIGGTTLSEEIREKGRCKSI